MRHNDPGTLNSLACAFTVSGKLCEHFMEQQQQQPPIRVLFKLLTTSTAVTPHRTLPPASVAACHLPSPLPSSSQVGKCRAVAMDVDALAAAHGLGPDELLGLFALIGNE